MYPDSPFAEKAKQALERIQSRGFRIRRYTFEELVNRAERLVYSGPIERANLALKELVDARLMADAGDRAPARALRVRVVAGEYRVAAGAALALRP